VVFDEGTDGDPDVSEGLDGGIDDDHGEHHQQRTQVDSQLHTW
jgi:hypothetical protein